MKIIDISQPLTKNIPTWPGDSTFQYRLNWSKEQTGSVNVGTFEMSVHTGTHVDAPYHFDNNGEKIGSVPLTHFIGAAIVVECLNQKSIGIETIKDINLSGISKVLFKTNSWTNTSIFPDEITYLEKELAPFLSSKGIDLIGVDVPSVDAIDSKSLDAHHSFYQNNIQILEGIVLKDVSPGKYELIALPLPLSDADGSPVRAVLIER